MLLLQQNEILLAVIADLAPGWWHHDIMLIRLLFSFYSEFMRPKDSYFQSTVAIW